MSQYIIEAVVDIETGEEKFDSAKHNGVFEELVPIEKGFTMMLLNMVTLRSIQTTPVKSIKKYEDILNVETKNSIYHLKEV